MTPRRKSGAEASGVYRFLTVVYSGGIIIGLMVAIFVRNWAIAAALLLILLASSAALKRGW